MISPDKFTVGTLGSAVPLSLILPRTQREGTAIIGIIHAAPAAVFLTGQHAYQCIPSGGNDYWRGLIIPDVRIEVDETSVFDPDMVDPVFGSVVRSDTRLTVTARTQNTFRESTAITLQENLASAGDLRAAFMKWQVVIGEGADKRVLWSMPEKDA